MANNFGSWHVDPSQLNNNNGNGMGQGQASFGNSQNPNSSYFTDDELMGSFNNAGDQVNAYDEFGNQNMSQNFSPAQGNSFHPMPQNQAQTFQNTNYSHTPEGAPIRSPFTSNNFDYSAWASAPQAAHMQQQRSNNRAVMQPHTGSLSRSPMTPAMNNLHAGTPDSHQMQNHNQQAVPAPVHRRQSSQQQWENSIGSGYSLLDSPMASPSNAQHPQISEVLKGGVASPSFSQTSGLGQSASKARTLEDKKAKRRASHNEVERKRRNNINAQISTLAKLVPGHRLEDDNIRRAVTANASLPAHLTGGPSGSPPNSSGTFLGPGSASRRGVGSITQGLPIEERDRTPAKGDVLNSSVSWVRDIMWLLNRMMNRESIMQETIESLGGQMPIQINDDEARMRSEVLDVFSRNETENSDYSRKDGSGLWVPNYTDHLGQRLGSTSPDNAQGGEGQDSTAFWAHYQNGRSSLGPNLDIQEEDEFNDSLAMEM